MEQKMNRVIRACVEMGNDNPIISIHDQGAGGPCNVLTELIEPVGGKIEIRKIRLGDKTLSVLEIWGAEYQERDALLIKPERIKQFAEICQRERADYEVLGKITGDGKVVVYDASNDSTPVNLELEKILGKMPQKTFTDKHLDLNLKPLEIPEDLSFAGALNNVLRLVGVGSKGFLVHKVDRSVTGLIAQQQCAGPLQLTVADVSVIAQSHLSITGAAISIGSWLDMAESELAVLSSQCLDRRIPDKPTLINQVAAWQENRNKRHVKADWQFTTDDARIKLKRLYPQFQ